ncbi:MAG: HTH domain-containing protein, partial [Sulfuricurvum sp.]|nr:HTH domain-containing protein [Sulfuricurvum sp.]
MTINDAILQALEDLNKPVNYTEVSNHVQMQKLCEFGGATPEQTVSANLGNFIRKNDSRVGRTKQGKTYLYYLTKNKNEDALLSSLEVVTTDEI